MLIKVKLGSLIGIAIQPFSTQVEREKIVHYLYSHNLFRVGFVDISPTADTYQLIKLMEEVGVKLAAFIDHHEDERKEDEISNAQAIYEIIGNKNFRFFPRQKYTSATMMLAAGEWLIMGLDALLFHYDIDGASAFFKGSELGYKYHWFDCVANAAESANGIRLEEQSLRFFRLMQKGMNLGPPYYFDSEKRDIALQELYSNIANWLYQDMNDSTIKDFIDEVDEVEKEATELSKIILRDTLQREDGFIYVDMYEWMKNGKRPNIQYLKREMFRLSDGYMLVAMRVLGHKGDQVSIFKPKQLNLFLPDLLPLEERFDWHIENRVHIKMENFSEFKNNYLRAIQ